MAFSSTSLEELTFDTTGDEEFGLPAGSTANRPASPSNGNMRYNTDESVVEAYINGEWVSVNSSEYYSFQGSTSGYTSNGYTGSDSNIIDKFSLTSDANATDVGDATTSRRFVSGQSSSSHGYTTGGGVTGNINIIDKFSFSVDGNATDVGDMAYTARILGGNSSESNGYVTGGDDDGEV